MWAASKLAIKADSVSFPRTEMHVKVHKQITVVGGQQGVTIKSKSILTLASLHAHIMTHSLSKGTRETHIDLELIHNVRKFWDVRFSGVIHETLRSLGIKWRAVREKRYRRFGGTCCLHILP